MFTTVTDYVVKFLAQNRDPDAHRFMNLIYQDAIPDPSRLFVDPATMDDLKTEREVIDLLRQIIAREVIAPMATQTSDINDITRIINSLPLYVEVNGSQRRLSRDSLQRALELAITNGKDSIEIRVGTSQIYFDPTNGPIDFTDWSQFSLTSIRAPVPPAPMTAAEIAAAVVGAIPTPPTAAELASAFASAYPQPTVTTSATAVTPSVPTSASTAGILFTFNSGALPSDVCTRYENKYKTKGLITGSMVRTPYSTGFRYHLEGADKLILPDGTFFQIQVPNEKEFLKATVYCEDDTHAGIRQWYQNFSQACLDYGYYAHPLWCFLPDHGGPEGFTVGDGPNDDLPKRMEIQIAKMTNVIYRVLCKKEMFPKGSRLVEIVQSCPGDGYSALKSVLFKSHPAFYAHPSTLIREYPKQKELSMTAYYRIFNDYLQVRAWIADITLTLDDLSELDIFIRNTKHNVYLNQVTREERRIPSIAIKKYRGTQLVETLSKFLLEADSPEWKEVTSSRHSKKDTLGKGGKTDYGSRKPYRKPFSAIVNAIAEVSDDDADDTTKEGPDEDDATDDDDPISAALLSIKVPKASKSRALYHVYCASVHRIQMEPDLARDTTCIVCDGKHRFDKCPILSNADFLRGHYVRYCQQLRRDSTAKAAALSGKNGGSPSRGAGSPTAKSLNFVDAQDDNYEGGSDTDTDGEDFQRGRG